MAQEDVNRSQNISHNQADHSDLMGNKSDNTNMFKTENLGEKSGRWVTQEDVSHAKSALESQWTYVDQTASHMTKSNLNKSQHIAPINSKMCSIYAEPVSNNQINLSRLDKNQTLKKSLVNSIEGNSLIEPPETLNDIGFSSQGFKSDFEKPLEMGEGHVPEFYQTKGSGFGKKKKKKVKKKMKRNLLPPTTKSNMHKPSSYYAGKNMEEMKKYYNTLDRIFELNPQPSDEQIDVFVPFLQSISGRVAELKIETLRKQYEEARDKPPEVKANFKENFAMADRNKNGVLDVNDFIVFYKMHTADMKKRIGEALFYSDFELKEHYSYLEKLSPQVQGVTAIDLLVANNIYIHSVAQDFESQNSQKEKMTKTQIMQQVDGSMNVTDIMN